MSFPTSGSASAQPEFLRGVLYLHSFEYDSAARAFHRAQAADPDFAMAYWGEALSHTHPVWNEQDVATARGVLARLGPAKEARLAKARTPRERAYFEAVELLYSEAPKARRDTLYAYAMERVVRENPSDLEAKAFYALALLGLNQGVRDFAAYMRAAAYADTVFRANPDHPGGAHYLIHAFDDPIHAPLGLEAARAYSRIAPDAGHAQHMTTHIFLALGMWDQVVSQNVIATDLTRWVPGHYTLWLLYGYLQQGKRAEARAVLDRVRGSLSPQTPASRRASLLMMKAYYLVDSQDWGGPVAGQAVDLAGAGPVAAAWTAYLEAQRAARAGDRAATERAVQGIEALSDSSKPFEILAKTARARLLELNGEREAAIALLQKAAAIEDGLPLEFGPPVIVEPSHELLGELLLRAGKPADAQRELLRQLALTPGRSRTLGDLARAAFAAGDREGSDRAYRQLERNWLGADPEVRLTLNAIHRELSQAP